MKREEVRREILEGEWEIRTTKEKSEEWKRVDNRGKEREKSRGTEEDAVRSQGRPQGQLSR